LNGNKVTFDQAIEIENATKGQNPKWFMERKWRLTASHFGEVLKCTERRDYAKFCETLFCAPALSTPPIIHGKTYEPIAIEIFEQKFNQKVNKSGLFVNDAFPNFAATPDGIIDEETIIEVKCPFNARNDLISESNCISFLQQNKDKSLQLKTSHNYYYQIQGQLAICKKSKCILIVYTFKDLECFEILYNPEFVETQMFPALEHFYTNVYLPFLTTKL